MNQTIINHSMSLKTQNSQSQYRNQNLYENDKESKQLLKYLNSQQSQIIDSPKHSQQIHNNAQQIPQKYYLLCPQLYESYRNEHCTEQLKFPTILIKKYSKGRNQLHFNKISQIQIPNIVKLTIWSNGDYKLIYNEQVYFWHQDQLILDKYCVTI